MFRQSGFWERVVQAGVTETLTEWNEKYVYVYVYIYVCMYVCVNPYNICRYTHMCVYINV